MIRTPAGQQGRAERFIHHVEIEILGTRQAISHRPQQVIHSVVDTAQNGTRLVGAAGNKSPGRSNPPRGKQDDENDQEDAHDADAAMTKAVAVAAEAAAEASEENDDEDDNEDGSERHVASPFVGCPFPGSGPT